MQIEQGIAFPLGVSKKDKGLNFALFSKHAQNVRLFLFSKNASAAFFEVTLDPEVHKTGDIWHILLSDPPDELEYGFSVDGSKVLLDPYALTLSTSNEWEEEKIWRGRIEPQVNFDWENDSPGKLDMHELIIYEMHVRGFARTYTQIIEKIPHLKKLGINAVELLPVFEFNECETKPCNYWGYSPVSFFCPMNRYADKTASLEFKQMVKALHQNGIEVILDVVFNHTAEGLNQIYSFRGIDDLVYYMHKPDGSYLDFSGCGNTLNCNHPVVAKMVLDSLRYWVCEMHVDGFRFDLASVFTRDEHGVPMKEPPLVHAITHDPVLAGSKLIAEAWDARGLYQVGSFPHWGRWAEWNGKYRDSARRFLKGADGYAGAFAGALCGSEELYGETRQPFHSINFITCHDGFTLRDLVSYQEKHNLANGENNRDGTDQNDSWNCGEEGPTSNPKIQELRERQMRNFHLALMISIGTPMLLMGDEYGHSRLGNNNAWCQDNELNYFLWEELEKNPNFFRFYTSLIHFRRKHPASFQRVSFLKKEEIDWHGLLPFQPDWSPASRFVAYTLKQDGLYIAFNASFHTAHVQLPPGKFKRIVDTSLPSPQDFVEDPIPISSSYEMLPYSAILLKI